jgi:hypothetical protein
VSAPQPAPLRAPGVIHEIDGDLVRVDLPGVARVTVRGGEVEEMLVHPQADAADVAWFREGHVRELAARRGIAGARRDALHKGLAARIEADDHRVMARLGYALRS